MSATGKLAGKVALITGASSGIGRAAARLFAREGAKVCATGRNGAALDALVAEITEAGGTALAIPADITDDRRRDEYVWDNHPHGPGEGRHCHCYLDGLFAVDWDEDKDSAFRSGFAPATDVIEHVKLMPNRSMFNWTEPTKEEMEKFRQ